MNTTPATDSLITARLLATARYTAVFNALLLALSAQQGGVWSVLQLILAAALLYCHIRIEFDRHVFQDFADSRDMPQRVSGALALWRKSLYLTAAQSAIFLIQLL